MSYFFTNEQRLAEAKRLAVTLPVSVEQVYFWLTSGFAAEQIVRAYRMHLSPDDAASFSDAVAELKR